MTSTDNRDAAVTEQPPTGPAAATVPTASDRRPVRRRFTIERRFVPVLGPVVVLIAMFTVGGLRYENFLTPLVVGNLLINTSWLVVLAVGMTFVILTGGIDLSVGAVVALTGITGAQLFASGLPAGVVIPAMILVGTLIGLVVGVMVEVFEIQPFIATLAAMFLARGLSFVVSLDAIPIRNDTVDALARFRIPLGEGARLTLPGMIALTTVVVAVIVLRYTRFGRTVYAIGGDESSARLMGLAVARTKILVYVISGTCAGLAGLLFAVYSKSGYSLSGVGMELDAIAAVVIGGTLLTGGSGYVLGSMLGVFVLGLIQTIITFEGTLSSWWTRIAIGALLLIFVVVQRLLVARAGPGGRA